MKRKSRKLLSSSLGLCCCGRSMNRNSSNPEMSWEAEITNFWRIIILLYEETSQNQKSGDRIRVSSSSLSSPPTDGILGIVSFFNLSYFHWGGWRVSLRLVPFAFSVASNVSWPDFLEWQLIFGWIRRFLLLGLLCRGLVASGSYSNDSHSWVCRSSSSFQTRRMNDISWMGCSKTVCALLSLAFLFHRVQSWQGDEKCMLLNWATTSPVSTSRCSCLIVFDWRQV